MNYSNPQRYKNGDGARFESERVSIKQQKERLILYKSTINIIGFGNYASGGVPVFADGNSVNGVRSLETQTELLEYATNVFPKHLHALVEIGDLNGAVEEYSLGEPFTVFNVEENTNSSCFPVLQNEDIVAILEISENHGEYNSSLSVSFARELEDILNSNMMKSCFTD